MDKLKTEKIPELVSSAILALKEAGYEAYIVGGCVRDLLLGRNPKDWDICTIALPEQTLSVFPEAKYENDFGTVLVSTDDPDVKFLEITTYRNESNYNDFRHPNTVNFVQSIEEDLTITYGFRNFGAHRIEDQPVVYKNFDKISERILNALFFSIEKLYI